MALKTCKECGNEVSSKAKTCPKCGAPVKKGIGCGGCLVSIIVIGLLASIAIPAFIGQREKARLRSQGSSTSVTKNQITQESPKLTPSEHLAKGMAALNEGYEPHNDPMKTRWGNVALAKEHLQAITTENPEYEEAQALLKEVARREREIEKVAKEVAKQIMIEQRKNLAKELERNYLNNGLDVYVTTQGKDHDVLKMKYILFSRPLVHQMVNDADFIATLRKAEFKKLIFTDGYDENWRYDLR